MKIWADIRNTEGVKVGSGPVWSLKSASVTRSLDKAGSIAVSAPGTEERAKDLLTNERRITVYTSYTDESRNTIVRTVGNGILRDIQARVSAAAWTLTADGPTSMDELKRKNTLLARLYSNVPLSQIASDLASLAGWTVSVDPLYAGKPLYDRFEGVSALKALQKLVERQGLHMREGSTARSLEIGPFGADSGVRLINAAYAPQEINRNPNVMLISTFGVSRMSEHIVNWLVPVGGGEGESAVTLEHCTRLGPYAVRTLTVNGKVHYYIADDASIATYGQIEKVGTFKDIVPVSNSDADLEAAANALYDAAVAFLLRNKERLDTYSVTVKKVRRTLNPGDKVRLSYKGFVKNEKGLLVNYVDVNEDFWVMRVSERIGMEGTTLTLDITNIDQEARTAGQVIIGAIESIQMQELRVQPYPALSNYIYENALDKDHSVIVPVEITNNVLYLNQCRLSIRSLSFRVLAKAAAAGEVTTSSTPVLTPTTSSGGALAPTSSGGGDHNHRMAILTSVSGFPGTSVRPFWMKNADGGGLIGVKLETAYDSEIWTESSSGNHTHSVTIPAHSHTVTIPSHSHTVPALLIDYGINDDTQRPDTVRIAIDGVDVTEEMGGPWGVGQSAIDISLDITRFLVNAPGGLRQKHEITYTCTGGQGAIQTIVEERLTIQSINVI